MSGASSNRPWQPAVEQHLDEWFEHYREDGGAADPSRFAELLEHFFQTTFRLWIEGDTRRTDGPPWTDRAEAFAHWATLAGCPEEARRVFRAIDRVTPYT